MAKNSPDLLVHAILGVRASPLLFRRAGRLPGSHGSDDDHARKRL